jgi:hypothetical protein
MTDIESELTELDSMSQPPRKWRKSSSQNSKTHAQARREEEGPSATKEFDLAEQAA